MAASTLATSPFGIGFGFGLRQRNHGTEHVTQIRAAEFPGAGVPAKQGRGRRLDKRVADAGNLVTRFVDLRHQHLVCGYDFGQQQINDTAVETNTRAEVAVAGPVEFCVVFEPGNVWQ